jgi:hypothetical protein
VKSNSTCARTHTHKKEEHGSGFIVLSLTHSHTHIHTKEEHGAGFIVLSFSLSLSLSLSHIHTYIHTYIHTHTHTHTRLLAKEVYRTTYFTELTNWLCSLASEHRHCYSLQTYYATNQKVAGLIPDGVIGIFH